MLLKNLEEAVRCAQGEIAKICASWGQPQWDELDWSRIKELTTRDILEHRNREAVKVKQAWCIACPSFVKHVSQP